jgi:chaperone modulatory protein CbpM
MNQNILEGILLDENTELSLNDLCRVCSCSEQWLIELVEEGALEPEGGVPIPGQATAAQAQQWRFSVISLERARIAMRLQRDLEINLAGVALALDLLNEIENLKSRLTIFEAQD